MHLKFIRFFLCDHQCRTTAICVMILAAVLVSEGYVLKSQNVSLTIYRGRKNVIDQISQWKNVLEKDPLPVKGETNLEIVLQGTVVEDHSFHAVINSQICTVGDIVEGYLVTQISSGRIIVKNMATQEIKEHRMFSEN